MKQNLIMLLIGVDKIIQFNVKVNLFLMEIMFSRNSSFSGPAIGCYYISSYPNLGKNKFIK